MTPIAVKIFGRRRIVGAVPNSTFSMHRRDDQENPQADGKVEVNIGTHQRVGQDN